jgi:glycosyltransferase involved in cell wall biosynthesis
MRGGLREKGYFKTCVADRPLISIITVVYNGAASIEDTIVSVIRQTYENVEYIIIDGLSTDGTIDIIKKYEDTIDFWLSEKDEGIYDAMNKAAKVAAGKWLMFINAGDKLLHIDERSLFAPFTTKTCHVYSVKDKRLFRNPLTKTYLTRNTPCHQSVQYLKSEFKLFDLEYGLDADYEQMTRIVSNSLLGCYSESIVYFDAPGASSALSKNSLFSSYYKRMTTLRKNISIWYFLLCGLHYFRRVICTAFTRKDNM